MTMSVSDHLPRFMCTRNYRVNLLSVLMTHFLPYDRLRLINLPALTTSHEPTRHYFELNLGRGSLLAHGVYKGCYSQANRFTDMYCG